MAEQTVQAVFLERLDLVQRMANRAFTGLEWQDKEEAMQEVVAQCWAFCAEAAERDRIGHGLVYHFAKRAILRVKSGRKLTDSGVRNDVCHRRTQRRYEYGMAHLGAMCVCPTRAKGFTRRTVDVVCDLADWMDTLPLRHQQAVCHLAEGLTIRETAQRVGRAQQVVSGWRAQWLASCPIL